MSVNDFDPPDRFVAGTVGPPGQRTFFLQVSEGRRVSSVSLEKQQVSVLADRINDMLDSFAGGEGGEHAAAEVEDNAPLDTPIEDEFRVNTLSLGWDEAREVVVIECLDRDPDEVPEEVEPDPVLSEEPRLIRVVTLIRASSRGTSSPRKKAHRPSVERGTGCTPVEVSCFNNAFS